MRCDNALMLFRHCIGNPAETLSITNVQSGLHQVLFQRRAGSVRIGVEFQQRLRHASVVETAVREDHLEDVGGAPGVRPLRQAAARARDAVRQVVPEGETLQIRQEPPPLVRRSEIALLNRLEPGLEHPRGRAGGGNEFQKTPVRRLAVEARRRLAALSLRQRDDAVADGTGPFQAGVPRPAPEKLHLLQDLLFPDPRGAEFGQILLGERAVRRHGLPSPFRDSLERIDFFIHHFRKKSMRRNGCGAAKSY